MFGDVMHGTILLIFAIYICWKADTIKKDSYLAAFVYPRYLLLFMGIFSTYCGLIYNDFTSMPLMIAKSCWTIKDQPVKGTTNKVITAIRPDKDCVYPFGLDYFWMQSDQEIIYLNSFKMKTAVIYGVAQMCLGSIIKCFNYIYDRKWVDLIFEGFTQIVMILCLFGFMDLLIISKWLTDWESPENKDKL
jgi:V-type H+-transporting ATPase subunit a